MHNASANTSPSVVAPSLANLGKSLESAEQAVIRATNALTGPIPASPGDERKIPSSVMPIADELKNLAEMAERVARLTNALAASLGA